MSKEDTAALAALVQYFFIKSMKDDNRVPRKELASSIPGLIELATAQIKNKETKSKNAEDVAAKYIDNLLNAGSSKGAEILKNHMYQLVDNDSFKTSSPDYIKLIIEQLYGDRSEEDQNLADNKTASDIFALSEVAEKIRYTDRRYRRLLADNLTGVWNILRYSAHVESDAQAKPLESQKIDALVVRAAIQIGPKTLDFGPGECWFELRYRPNDTMSPDFLKTTGGIFLINNGNQFQMSGYEHGSGTPIYIIGNFNQTRQNSFYGLVLRKHEQGQIITSRVAFLRSEESLELLTGKIGLKYESEMLKNDVAEFNDLEKVLERVTNVVRNNGKCALIL